MSVSLFNLNHFNYFSLINAKNKKKQIHECFAYKICTYFHAAIDVGYIYAQNTSPHLSNVLVFYYISFGFI